MNTNNYVTDGQCLYEILAERVDRNYGLAGGTFRRVILRDCMTGEMGIANGCTCSRSRVELHHRSICPFSCATVLRVLRLPRWSCMIKPRAEVSSSCTSCVLMMLMMPS